MTMLHTAEIDMGDSVKPSDIDVFLSDAAWAIRSTYNTVLKASPGAAIFGRDDNVYLELLTAQYGIAFLATNTIPKLRSEGWNTVQRCFAQLSTTDARFVASCEMGRGGFNAIPWLLNVREEFRDIHVVEASADVAEVGE